MADHKHIVPFILSAEGGYVNNSSDKGGETNRGITYEVWKKYFGDTHDRFMSMSQEDWGLIYYNEYWCKILGDKINSQRIADCIADWCFNSGRYYPEKDIQEVLNAQFGKHLTADGVPGRQTIDSINSCDEEIEYNAIIQRHIDYVNNIVKNDSSQKIFLQGWLNRIENLKKFEIANG